MLIPKRIIVHHSLTVDSKTVSWGAIRHFHMNDLNYMYSDIGYHAGIELVQSGEYLSYEILMGRAWNEVGAHTKGQNYDSLGICFVGNYDIIKPNDDMLIVGSKILKLWMSLYDISVDDIYPHSFFNSDKTCPGLLFNMDDLKYLVRLL